MSGYQITMILLWIPTLLFSFATLIIEILIFLENRKDQEKNDASPVQPKGETPLIEK